MKAFLDVPGYRERFRVTDHAGHATEAVEVAGGTVQVDRAIAAAVAGLNRLGITTKYSCQGGGEEGSQPYIWASRDGEPFPEDLLMAWRGTGYTVFPHHVQVPSPFGMSDAAAQVFQNSLRDWLDGKLDLEGKRYRVLGKRPDSRPDIPPMPEHAKSGDAHRCVAHRSGSGGCRCCGIIWAG